VTEAWGPLGQGLGLLSEPALVSLAADLGRMPAQVALRWHLEQGYGAIPKTVNSERMRENLQAVEFTLGPEEMAVLAGLDRGRRLGAGPETHGFL
jgi:diketogulonate reductase-like aldo/keto reductase